MALYLAGSQVLRTPRLYPEARFQVSDRFGMFTAPHRGCGIRLRLVAVPRPGHRRGLRRRRDPDRSPRSFALLIAYSLGMGVSFLLVGLAFGRWATPLNFVKRHMKTLTLASAALLAVFGLLLMFNRLWWLSAQLTNFLDWLGLDSLVELG